MRHPFLPTTLTAMLAIAGPALAQKTGDDDVRFLENFDGRFTGTGRLQKAGGTSHNLNCRFDGERQGTRISLIGRCSTALVFSTTVSIVLAFNPATQRYGGSFREGRGTVAELSGARRGDSLSLTYTETAESTRPGPPATLTIRRSDNGLALSLRSSHPARGQNIDLALNEV